MKGALIILAALILTGLVLYLLHRRDVKRGTDLPPTMGPMPDRKQDEDGDDSRSSTPSPGATPRATPRRRRSNFATCC